MCTPLTNQSKLNIQNNVALPNVSERESIDILQKLKKINFSYFFRPDYDLKKKLEKVDNINLSNILKSLFSEMIEEDKISDPIKFLDRLSNIIPLEKIQSAIETLDEVKSMVNQAKLYIQKSKKDHINIRMYVSSIIDGIISIIASIVNAFGIAELFRPSNNTIQTDYNSQQIIGKIFVLIGMFSTLTTLLGPIIGTETLNYPINKFLSLPKF